MRSSLRLQILASLIALGLVPLLLLSVWIYHTIGRSVREAEKHRISEVNSVRASHIAMLMKRTADDLKGLQGNPHLHDPDNIPEDGKREMRRVAEVYEMFSDLNLYDTKGYLRYSTTEKDPPLPKDYTAHFEIARDGERTVAPPGIRMIEAPESKEKAQILEISVYLPVKDEETGTVHGVLMARMGFESVASIITGVAGDANEALVLMDHHGNIISSSFGDKSLVKEKFDKTKKGISHWAAAPIGIYERDGEEFLYSANLIEAEATQVENPWLLLSLQKTDRSKELLGNLFRVILFATVITVVLAALLGLFLAIQVSRPVVALNAAVKAISDGDLERRANETEGAMEVRELAESFNQMVGELEAHQLRLEDQVSQRTASLRESREILELTFARLRAAFNASQDGILVTGSDGNVVMGNPVFSKLLALEPDEVESLSEIGLRERFISRIENKDDARKFLQASLQPDSVFEHEFQLKPDEDDPGEASTIFFYTTPIVGQADAGGGRLWVLRDLTEKRRLEENLRQSQKMEAIGTLAGGVAHDFNNLLTGITGHLSLLDMEHLGENDTNNRDLLRHAMQASERATELVKQLLGFSRRSHINLVACNANSVATEVHDLLRASVDPGVKIKLDLEEDPYYVMSDPNLISQIIMNMAVNARDAMPGGGTITIRTENRIVSEDESQSNPEAKPGDHFCVIVEDDGDGIPYAIQKKIFDPFFTTKEQGKGTGLGLATCFGIAKQLGGWITFESEPGQGTTFYIHLPRTEKPEEATEADPGSIDLGKGKNETLLLVDDELVVRSVAETLLKKLGYDILTASNGAEALEVYSRHEKEIDLVMFDMTMPEMCGDEAFCELRKRFPYVPVLICSGYLVDLKAFEDGSGHIPDGFVQKPYQIEKMAVTVREVLDNAEERAA